MTTTPEDRESGRFAPIPRAQDLIATQVVDAVYRVHKQLGPGLVEEVYETCLCHELKKRRLLINFNVPLIKDGIHRVVL